MPSCPSCPLEQTPYDDQLAKKRERLTRALGAYPRYEQVQAELPQPSPDQQGYRNRARMVVRTQADSPDAILGFYEEGSRQVVPVERCEAHHPSLQAVLEALRPLLFRSGALRHFAQFVDARSTAGFAAGEESVIVTLAGELSGTESASEEGSQKLVELEEHAAALHRELDQSVDEVRVSVHLNVDRQQSQSVLSGEQRLVAGDAWLEYALESKGGDRLFRVRPTTFFQVNLPQLEQVHRRMAHHLLENSNSKGADQPARLVDLYCGVGAHGIVLASADAELFGTDIVEPSVELARDNATRAGLEAQFVAASDTDAAAWLGDQLEERSFSLITNPARAGMSPETIDFVAHSRPSTILYLSCEPRTLTRDLDRLLDRGYRLRSVEAFDFMPQTDQIETLAVIDAVDEPPKLTRERAYEPRAPEKRRFSLGVSGPLGLPDEVDQAVWVALVAGETPKHGFLPKARGLDDQQRIEINRLRKVEGNSVLRIEAPTLDDAHIRQRLRAWNHPVIGDEEFGDRNANHLAARHAFLDRMALHCVLAKAGEQTWTAEVPGGFLGLMRLPRKVLGG